MKKICIVFVLLAILQSSICTSSICHARVIDDTRRTKRETSVAETSQSKGDASSYAKQMNLEHEETGDDDSEENDALQDNEKEKRTVSRKTMDSVISANVHPPNAEESDHDDESSDLNSQRSGEEPEEADGERNKNEEASDLVRLPRDLDKYTNQDERSSLYDDYEAKDIAKRGVLSGSKDYEEIEEDDSPGISEDTAAVQESASEAERRETRRDARMKRDRAEISEGLDKSQSSPGDPAKLEESKTRNPYSREASRIELSGSFNEASPPAASEIKSFASKDVRSESSEPSKIQEPTNKVTSSGRDEANAEYERRVEAEIQRKIDSLKEDIQRDIEAQLRMRDVEDNNARFDELRDEEREDEERRKFKEEPIEKRQTVVKRSIREVVADGDAVSSKTNEKKRFPRRKQKHHHRLGKIGKLDTSKENEKLKKRFVTNESFEKIPSRGFSKKKREHARQIFLINNDQMKKRQLRSSTSPSDRTAVRPENEFFMNPESISYPHTDNRMLQVPLPAGEDENNEGEQSPTAKRSDSLVSLTGSLQELSPRLEKEYKEAFGGLQSESGSALARFKRIKRVLAGPNAKI